MRKRTNLDTSEANFLYAKVLLRFNKNEKLKDLPIPIKNKLIDEVCEKIIEKTNENPEDAEALKFEVTAYKLSDEEREKSFSTDVYERVEKPEGFNDYLKNKYARIIDEEIDALSSKNSFDFRNQ